MEILIFFLIQILMMWLLQNFVHEMIAVPNIDRVYHTSQQNCLKGSGACPYHDMPCDNMDEEVLSNL